MKTTKLTDVSGIGPAKAKVLEANGIDSVEKFVATDASVICEIPGFKEALTETLQKAAQDLLSAPEPAVEEQPAVPAVEEAAVEEAAVEEDAAVEDSPEEAVVEKKKKDKKKGKDKKAKDKKSDKKSKDKKSKGKKSDKKSKDKKSKKKKK